MPGAVITLDALHATEQTMALIPEQTRADYLIQAKHNCETLRQAIDLACDLFPLERVPFITYDKEHGRHERRSLTVAALDPESTGKPHTWCALRVSRWREPKRAGKSLGGTEHCAYYVGSFNALSYSPAAYATMLRGHWGIENALHHRKDRSMDEDRNTARLDALGKVTVALRSVTAMILDRASEHTKTINIRLCAKPQIAIGLLKAKSLEDWESKYRPYRLKTTKPKSQP